MRLPNQWRSLGSIRIAIIIIIIITSHPLCSTLDSEYYRRLNAIGKNKIWIMNNISGSNQTVFLMLWFIKVEKLVKQNSMNFIKVLDIPSYDSKSRTYSWQRMSWLIVMEELRIAVSLAWWCHSILMCLWILSGVLQGLIQCYPARWHESQP